VEVKRVREQVGLSYRERASQIFPLIGRVCSIFLFREFSNGTVILAQKVPLKVLEDLSQLESQH